MSVCQFGCLCKREQIGAKLDLCIGLRRIVVPWWWEGDDDVKVSAELTNLRYDVIYTWTDVCVYVKRKEKSTLIGLEVMIVFVSHVHYYLMEEIQMRIHRGNDKLM